MKKYIIYIAVLTVGFLLGWILFGGNTTSTEAVHKHNEATETNQMWTCSMHPQIMQPEAGDCPICGMDLIPAASSAKGLLADQFKLSKNAMALANIQTSIVGKSVSNENSGFILSGKITENENETATMPAHFNGRVEKLFVNSLGERVKKGQAVAQIYSPALIAAQQELITAYKLKASQPQLYNAVKNKFKNWMIHGKQLEEVEQTGQVKNSFTIYSHVSGVVTEIAINVGSHIMDGKPIFKVSNLNSVWANFDVYENQISQFKKGQNIVITTNAYSNKEFKGKVDFIDPILDSKTRTVKLRVVLNNKNELFKPGMFVEGKIKGVDSSIKKQVLSIPASAILWTGKRSVVYLKSNANEPVFQMQKITLGNQFGDNYQVLEGLNNGDEIVTNGTFTVDAAAQLQGKKSMMNKKGGKVMTGHEGHLGMNNNSSEVKKPLNKNERIAVSKEFQNQLNIVFNTYIELKNALAIDNTQNLKKQSKQLIANLGKVDMKLLKSKNAHQHWMPLEKELKATANLISNTDDIKVQRTYFKNLSSNMATVLEVFGIHEKVYHLYCPMSDNNKGAYWLSKEEKVVNPYFGGAMLTCGEVKQVIE
ncbi:efflux RND transporter periplasmic adaptor subunit [Polaribacter sp. R2A056_3_33]|uniref:efflux RND transporter periplasmic adaptor subunit n=1 Tax=Polaribacter sp. R2A056_3_33 TaxID=2745563 RepID=UPI001C4E43F7|nr:efflux RND transporter periplasmic adaptor subunit [Polaribacter sp. R2A056_3_33]QXP69328.1 efflux RND transporter periplasmic adaptor subunit [Polaribacter sp. R2A056_3_33]